MKDKITNCKNCIHSYEVHGVKCIYDCDESYSGHELSELAALEQQQPIIKTTINKSNLTPIKTAEDQEGKKQDKDKPDYDKMVFGPGDDNYDRNKPFTGRSEHINKQKECFGPLCPYSIDPRSQCEWFDPEGEMFTCFIIQQPACICQGINCGHFKQIVNYLEIPKKR